MLCRRNTVDICTHVNIDPQNSFKSLKRRIYLFQSFSFYREAKMPPRRAPSVPSVASRAPSPVMEEDEVKELICESITLC